MPAKVVKRGDKYRIIDADTKKIMKNRAGTSVDGGGHNSKVKAEGQARAINTSLSKRHII